LIATGPGSSGPSDLPGVGGVGGVREAAERGPFSPDIPIGKKEEGRRDEYKFLD
jgi:hypothetical protein